MKKRPFLVFFKVNIQFPVFFIALFFPFHTTSA